MKFGDILRELLEERDITQIQFANDIQITAPTLNHYICNTREPDFEMLKIISNYFHVSIDFLLGNTTQDSYRLTADEQNLIRKYRSLTDEQKEICQGLERLYIKQNQKK